MIRSQNFRNFVWLVGFLLLLAACNGVTEDPDPGDPDPETFSLSVTLAGDGEGTVTSSPGNIDCGNICSAEFDEDTEVTLTAQAGAESTFEGWAGCDSNTNGTCTITMNDDRVVTATFDADQDDDETQELSQQEAAAMAQISVSAIGRFGSAFADPSGFIDGFAPSTSASSISPQNDDCIVRDEDEGNDVLTITADCDEQSQFFSYTLTGEIVIEGYLDITTGYRARTEDTLKYWFESGGSSQSFTIDFDIEVAAAANTYSVEGNYDFVSNGTGVAFDIDYTFTPDDPNASNPFESGTIDFEGTLNFTFGADSYTLTIATDPTITLFSTCEEGPTSGALSVTDGTNVVRVDANGCGDYVVTYNGNVISTSQ